MGRPADDNEPIVEQDEMNAFFDQYSKNHRYCPVCGGEECETTLAGYPLDLAHKDQYKDLNKARCSACGNVHTVHDRVGEKTPR